MNPPPPTAERADRVLLEGPHSRLGELRLVAGALLDFLRGFRALHFVGPCVTVFGSARFPEGHAYYALGRDVGRRLVELGFTVLTGGGPGLTEGGRTVGRVQHRAPRRATPERLPRPGGHLPPLLRAQSDALQVLVRLRRAARRDRNGRRAVRSAHAHPDRQDRTLPGDPGGHGVLAAARRAARADGRIAHDRPLRSRPLPRHGRSRRRDATPPCPRDRALRPPRPARAPRVALARRIRAGRAAGARGLKRASRRARAICEPAVAAAMVRAPCPTRPEVTDDPRARAGTPRARARLGIRSHGARRAPWERSEEHTSEL